jgi:hypothetical protein
VVGVPNKLDPPALKITSITTTMAEVISAANTALTGRLKTNMTRSCFAEG